MTESEQPTLDRRDAQEAHASRKSDEETPSSRSLYPGVMNQAEARDLLGHLLVAHSLQEATSERSVMRLWEIHDRLHQSGIAPGTSGAAK
jgi:hypothetical protein